MIMHHYNARRAPTFAEEIAESARLALILELETYPKPGLVSPRDRGSHADMDADTFRASINAIVPHFVALAEAGYSRCEMAQLRKIGLAAERDMLAATRGINTHRGAIFSLGLLCAAAGLRSSGGALYHFTLGEIVERLWSHDILRGPMLMQSHGQVARQAYGAGGAQYEAAQGFPSIYQVALPILSRFNDAENSRVEACFALIATVDDTNLLYRGGRDGLAFAQSEARGFLQDGGMRNPRWRDEAAAIHRRFIERRLSPGGSADLLACALFVQMMDRALPRTQGL